MININLQQQLKSLNENQKRAVLHLDKPLFVVAGAGTGKTNTLTTKIAYLIESVNVNPENILALTFTNKAAKEIRERVNNLIFPKQTGSWLYTFHAFALRILRSHAESLNIGYSNDFTIIDEDDAAKILKEIIDSLQDILVENYKPRMMKNLISNHKTNIEKLVEEDHFLIYEKYRDELIRNNLMDFDDLIVYVHKLITKDTKILNQYQNQFKYILVDEFQDTDILQYQIIKALNSPNTFVVGDPDQSIYAFRGARYENNENFVKDFEAEVIVLDLNYRSTNNILNKANQLIKYNSDRTTEKDLRSDLGLGNEVVISNFNNGNEEVEAVVREINKLKYSGNYNYSDFAILYRNNALSRLFEHELTRHQIPYMVYGGLSFYERKEVKDFLAYLQVIVSEKSDFFFKRIVNVPSRKIGKVTINKLEQFALKSNMTMFNAIDYVTTLNDATVKRLKEFKELILKMRQEIKTLDNLAKVVDIIYYETNYNDLLKSEASEVADDRRANIFELKNVFYEANHALEHDNLSKIKSVLDDLALMTSLDNSDSIDTVKISTVHQVKGLEFDVVFIVALEEETFPNFRVFGDPTKLNEERRLLYVGMTRARKRLYLSFADTRYVFGQLKYNLPSIFINEIKRAETKLESQNNNALYKTGDVVEHQAFGKGIVITTIGDVIQIAFNHEYGIKKINASFKGMKKVS